MGDLLKEALKTLCGVNQWSYAVFWKICCQNPKLLIWEECYCVPCSGLPGISRNDNPEFAFQDYNASWISAETRNLQTSVQAGNKVHLLVDKMMLDNHVNIVGEGLVGTAAFTGNHHWILSENYHGEGHPPEVLKEAFQQFSAGTQTVAVIPVFPHGVVQFGSYLTIKENMGFVNDVTSLVLQLGYVPGVWLSDNYAGKELTPKIGVQECLEISTPGDLSLESNMINASPFIDDGFNYVRSSAPTPVFDSQTSYSVESMIPNGLQSNIAVFQASNSSGSDLKPHDYHQETIIASAVKFDMDNKFAKRELNACKEEMEFDSTARDIPRSQFNENLNMVELIPNFVEDDRMQNYGDHSYSVKNTNYKDACVQPQSGDDLFDIFDADLKNKLFSSSWNNCLSNGSAPNTYNHDNNIKSRASISEGHSDSGNFSWAGTDNLLDAVVSKVHLSGKRSLDDNVSCRTTMVNTSSFSVPNASLLYGRFGVTDHVKGELLGIPKCPTKEGNVSACSLRNGSSKEDSGTFSLGSSIYGSQISSIEKGHNSTCSVYSKKPDETSKTNRKRLKPGENPKPRPKDRQMIQDRVKELREIVPNGTKCSIDALLERTIKHMLFLQSVTKHADKLKQAGESKIISKDGGLLLKDNFEGGATWACEVGSQSMICPIIVEDLNQPRQMLVEMLCEERCMFLEIADIIREMGLTILKGIMETRNDKIWARFAVEANRDVTRMEIFISLVRFLEQNAKSGVAPPNDISTDSMMIQQFQQAASVPETGRSRSLQ